MDPRPAPEWRTTHWLNTAEPLTLAGLRGRVVLVHAFQMLCPGCVARGIPQAQRVAALFADEPLVVLGLHTVFEHHGAMQLESLRAFVSEYQIRFPVGVDAPDPEGGPIPQTMSLYGMRGTPTTLLIDAQGRLRRQVFGAHEDLMLGAELQTLLLEARASHPGANDRAGSGADAPRTEPTGSCDPRGCAAPKARGAM